jgi:hypothetical protein
VGGDKMNDESFKLLSIIWSNMLVIMGFMSYSYYYGMNQSYIDGLSLMSNSRMSIVEFYNSDSDYFVTLLKYFAL